MKTAGGGLPGAVGVPARVGRMGIGMAAEVGGGGSDGNGSGDVGGCSTRAVAKGSSSERTIIVFKLNNPLRNLQSERSGTNVALRRV